MKQKIFRVIADLRFCIFLLLWISLSSILGTIIEQDQSLEVYQQNYPLSHPLFGVLTWDRIFRFQLNQVYQSWWFLFLLFLFALSLISCTLLQQLPSLKIARRCQFFRGNTFFYNLKISTIADTLSFTNLLIRTQKENYSIFQQKNIGYCYKGLTGRLAPIMVHLSMILILFGTILGSCFGFKAQEIVPKTEQFHIQNLFRNGQLTSLPNRSTRINDFWITYTSSDTVSQFYSDLSILNPQGKELTRKTISVNDPLIYDSIYYYQTDWNFLGIRLQTMSPEIAEYPLKNLVWKGTKVWLTWIPANQRFTQGIISILENLEGYCSLYDFSGKFLGNLEVQETDLGFSKVGLLEIMSSTGLQIKADPGIPMIYSGFFFLMISTLISYSTYSQLWMLKKEGKIWMGGTTNRAIFEFELEFLKIIQKNIDKK